MQTTAALLSALRSWPRAVPSDLPVLLRESAQHAARVAGVPRVLMIWEDEEEPWLHLAHCTSAGDFQWVQEPPGKFEPVIAEELRLSAFVHFPNGPERKRISSPLHPELMKRFDVRSFVCAPFLGQFITGHLLLLDIDPDPELPATCEVLAGLIVSRMDQFIALQKSREDAVTEERIRVARDLHDGLLQSFTGVVLQLETVHQLLEQEPETARRRITELQGVIMSDQRELRSYLEQLRPRSLRSEGSFELVRPMVELRERYQRQWEIDVDFEVEIGSASISHSLGQEVARLIAEAVANAAKHGAARNIFVKVSADSSQLSVTVHDDGTGFPFQGRYDLRMLQDEGVGPVSLRERLVSLGGNLVIESAESGANIVMEVPLTWPGA